MKIEGPNKTNKTNGTSKSSGVSSMDATAFRGLMSTENAPETAQTTATKSIASLDILLAVQSVEDPTEKSARKRMAMRARDILSTLDAIRVGLLAGTLTVGHMIDIADVVASHRDRIHDPALTSLMDEVDLRAQVEIAKLRVALNQSSLR